MKKTTTGLLWLTMFASVPWTMAPSPAWSNTTLPLTAPVVDRPVCATLYPDAGDNSQRIQQAIDQCSPGSAVKLVAVGQRNTFVSKPLRMRSGVWLWIDRNTILAASTQPADYDLGTGSCGTLNQTGHGCRPFISFNHVDNAGIVGLGEINGQGGEPMQGSTQSWWQIARQAQQRKKQQNVPRLIEADHAKHLLFYQVRLKNSPNFHLVLNNVDDVTVWGIIIDTPSTARNTDGIDPGSASNVTIAHTFIRTGDDNVAIKAGSKGATHDITLVDNHFYSGHGMSIGSETQAGVSHILVKNLTLDGTTSGLRIKSAADRGGVVEDVTYQNICLRNNRRPIDIDTQYADGHKGHLIPWFRAIHLKNVSAEGGDNVIRGYDADHPVQILFDGVYVQGPMTWQREHAHIQVGPQGLTPLPQGVSGNTVIKTPDCHMQWLPFPEDTLSLHG